MLNKDSENDLSPDKKSTSTESADVLLEKLKPLITRCLVLNHDINNPLAGIIGYTELLLSEDEPLTETQKESLNQIQVCAERIEKEINDLCDIKIELSEEVDINNIFPDDKL